MTNRKLYIGFLDYYGGLISRIDVTYSLFLFNVGLSLNESKDKETIDKCLQFIKMFNNDRKGIVSCLHYILYKLDNTNNDGKLILSIGRQILTLMASLVDDIEQDVFKDIPYRKELLKTINQQHKNLVRYINRHIAPLAREKS